MPSSGWGMVDIIKCKLPEEGDEYNKRVRFTLNEIEAARQNHLLIEWLECYISAFNQGADPYQCAAAGGQEWDF